MSQELMPEETAKPAQDRKTESEQEAAKVCREKTPLTQQLIQHRLQALQGPWAAVWESQLCVGSNHGTKLCHCSMSAQWLSCSMPEITGADPSPGPTANLLSPGQGQS